jgi:peptidyl-prolyl cis-trans isomerase SurA
MGYHIVKNLGERKALGKISVAQILLAFPPDADTNAKKQVEQKADSLYQALLQGADFKALAAAFSNDNISYQTGGELPEFGVGRYAPDFENAAFGITKDGAFI